LGILPVAQSDDGSGDGDYEVCIDSKLEDGFLTYGECFLPVPRPTILVCHACHPSLANDNLSGLTKRSLWPSFIQS
jgi:aminopeptidase-like protein